MASKLRSTLRRPTDAPQYRAVRVRLLAERARDRRAAETLSQRGGGAARRLDPIKPGDFYGLLGPNGAGKSTLIHCTTGLAQPTGGQIHVFGHDAISDYGEARTAVGLAPQEVNLDQFLTCEETLEFHGGYFGMRKQDRKERTEELLRDLLPDRESARAHPGPLRRDETPADPGAGADAPAAPADPRRADRRRRHRAAAGALALRPENQRRRRDDPAHHPLPRGGRPALRAGSPSSPRARSPAQGSSEELAARYDVANLEDAYLALVGRRELSRSHVEADIVA